MPADRNTGAKPPAAPRGSPFTASPGSRNRGFASSDPERQPQAPATPQRPAPAGAQPHEKVPQPSREAPATDAARGQRGRD